MPTTTSSDPWTAPGAFEVARGVYRMPLPLPNDGLRAVNVYALVDGDDLVLIDGGWAVPDAREALEAALADLDASIGDIRRFLVTHLHRDHYSQAVAVRRDFGTRVGLGIGELPSLRAVRQVNRSPLQPQVSLLRAYGASVIADRILVELRGHNTDRSLWEDPDDWLEESQQLDVAGRRLDAVATPGHTQGHVVFVDRNAGLMFTGDHVLPTITPSIGFEAVMPLNPLGDFLSSLAKVRQMPDAVLLPAHGPVALSVHRRIDELVGHHGRRLDQTESAVANGASSVFEVAQVLRWTRRERSFDELDIFNQMLAITETGAHVILLLSQGRLARVVDEDGVQYYRTA